MRLHILNAGYLAYKANKNEPIIIPKFVSVKTVLCVTKDPSKGAKAMEFYCITHVPAAATGDFGTSLEDVVLVPGKFIPRRVLSKTLYTKKFKVSDT